MKADSEDKQIRDYLLGRLNDRDEQALEENLLRDEVFAEQIRLVEGELIEDYVRGTLDATERECFEGYFLSTPRRRRNLVLVHELMKYAAKTRRTRGAAVVMAPRRGIPRLSLLFAPRWKFAVLAIIMCVAAVGLWQAFLHRSGVDEGLRALNAAYRAQRPLQSRITGLAYAPFPTTRGGGVSRVDERVLDHSGLLLLRAVNQMPDPAALHALGRYYLTKKEFEKAVQQFEEALKAAPQVAQLHADLGAALLEKAKADRARGETGLSGAEFGRSLEELTRALALDPSLLEALFNRALCRQEMKLDAQAEADWKLYLEKDLQSEWAEEARQHLKQLEESRKKARLGQESLFDDFLAAYNSRDGTRAWEVFSQARARAGNAVSERLLDNFLASAARGHSTESDTLLQPLIYAGDLASEKVGDRFTRDLAAFYKNLSPAQAQAVAEARGVMKRASELVNRAEFEAAAHLFAKAQSQFQQAGNSAEAALAEGRRLHCLVRLNDTESCLALGTRLAQACEQKGYRSLLAHVLNLTADAYTVDEELSQVISHAERAMKVCEETDDSDGAFDSLGILQFALCELGRNEESLKAGLAALAKVSRPALPPKRLWPLYSKLSDTYLQMGYRAAALEAQQEALALASQSQSPQIKSLSYARLALIHGRSGNYGEGIRYGWSALEEAAKVENEPVKLDLLVSSHVFLGHLYRQAGDLVQAVSHYDHAIPLAERTGYHFYLSQARQGKFLSHLSAGKDRQAEIELEKALEVADKYRGKILEESNRNAFFNLGQDIYDAAIDFHYSRKRDAARAFQYAEESRARSLLDARQSGAQIVRRESGIDLHLPSVARPLDLTAVRQRLPEKTQIVEYAVLPDKVIIWVISANDFVAVESRISAQEISAAADDYLRLVSDPVQSASAEAAARARRLYSLLIEPVARHLDTAATICIVRDSSLRLLPFSSLVSPETGRYLIEDYALMFAPSATTFILCSEGARGKPPREDESVLCVGNPHFDSRLFPELPELPAARIEAERVAALSKNSLLLLGDRAKEEAVRQAMARADVIHIASHSLEDQRTPLLSKLLLTQPEESEHADEAHDGVLHAYEIYEMKLVRPRLAVLSACRTGIGRESRGEGILSFVRPFLAAGVPTVVAALWDVDSSATSELMVRFHRLRREQLLATAQALRTAQLEMLRGTEPSRRQPSAWAAFAAFGGHTKN